MFKIRLGYNLMIMLENMKSILQEECQLDKDLPVVVGVSGGPDSLCAMDVLLRSGYSVVVAHFNHKLRPTADADANTIRKLANQLHLQFYLGEKDVEARAERKKESIEEAARNERYRFLFDCAEKASAQAVVVGHSADDQVETVLMHFLRGAGMSGLSGMKTITLPNPWSEKIPLVRPLLGIWRSQILAYCKEHRLDPLEDISNQDVTFFRNRLRHELIPFLETYNPAARKVIWRTAEVMRGELELVERSVKIAWKDCLVAQGDDFISLDSRCFARYPLSIRRQLIRMGIAQLRSGLRDISFDAIERGVNAVGSTQPFVEIDLISGLKQIVEPGRVWIAEWAAEIPAEVWPQVSEGEIDLEIGGIVKLQAGWQLTAEFVSQTNQKERKSWEDMDASRVWIDKNQIQLPFRVRGRRAGDRLQPFGMDGHSLKVSEFMVNEKLPLRARDKWPLVCSGEQIVWICGYRLAHPFRVTKATTDVVELTLARTDERTD
jgi:tRNA(Ile)-lysidine synthase